jgi:tetraacyldisaccharide 4'-kinase
LNIAKYILSPFAFLYGVIVTVRNVLFDIGILNSQRFPLWVISIGNLSVGGTGKSPHAEYMARLFEHLSKNYENLDLPLKKIAILSRGYGRANGGFLLVNTTSNATEVGDEPLQLKRKLNDVTVAVDEKRANGIKALLSFNSHLRAVILDDAFQHRYVKRDLSVLLTNYNAPFYKDHMLPAGRLREPRRGYKRAQLIIVTNTPSNITDIEKKLILKDIAPKHKQKVFYSSIIYKSLIPVFTGNSTIPELDKNYSVLLLTGIANAHSLYTHLAEIARDVIHIPFPDHHNFHPSDIAKVIKVFDAISNPNKIIITTEKDAMRLQSGSLITEFGTAQVYYIPIKVKVHEEEKLEEAIISSLTPLGNDKPIRKLSK